MDAHGSARSVEAVNITSAIAANVELVKRFGGHPMAAGLEIDQECIPDFRKAISRTVQAMGGGIQIEKSLQIDAYLSLPKLSLDLVEDLERLAPFGAGNPPVVLASRNLKLTGYAVVGRADEHLQLTIEDELGYTHSSVWWQGAGFVLPENIFDLAYTVRASTYRGQRDVQIEWLDYRAADSLKISSSSEKRLVEVIDMRESTEPGDELIHIQDNEQVVVWGEAISRSGKPFYDRFSLNTSDILAIWTIPPGFDQLREVLLKVKPVKIYLFGINPGMDEPEPFLRRLMGLLKYRIKSKSGITSFSTLAAATAQKISTIMIALEWLEVHGHIRVLSIDSDAIRMEAGTKINSTVAGTSSARLNAVLAESAAFRRYYLKANKNRLINDE